MMSFKQLIKINKLTPLKGFAGEIQLLLYKALIDEDVILSLVDVCEILDKSRRTIQRELQLVGVTFQGISTAIRKYNVLRQLSISHKSKVQDLAEECGFIDYLALQQFCGDHLGGSTKTIYNIVNGKSIPLPFAFTNQSTAIVKFELAVQNLDDLQEEIERLILPKRMKQNINQLTNRAKLLLGELKNNH